MITLEEIYAGLASEFQTRTGKTAGASSELAVRFYAVAAQIYALYVQGEWTRRQCFPQTAQGEELDKHAQIRGVTRRQAAKAGGAVRFYVDEAQAAEVEIPAGTVCMTAGGVRFATTQAAAVAPGALYAQAPVEAVEAGAAGNVGAGAVVYMSLPPVRIVACANPEPFTNGLDQEGDDSLRERVLATYRRLANGANSAFYRQAAMSFPEVAAVTVLPKNRGVGTVDIVPAARGGVPSQALLAEMQSYFDQVREIAVDVEVNAPTVETVNLSLKLWAEEGRDFDDVSEAVEDALTAWFNGERLGKSLPRAQLTSLVFAVDGVDNCQILQPEADLELSSVTLPVLGTVTIANGAAAETAPEPEPPAEGETEQEESQTGQGEGVSE